MIVGPAAAAATPALLVPDIMAWLGTEAHSMIVGGLGNTCLALA